MKTQHNNITCIRLGGEKLCPVCSSETIIKNGKTNANKQRYKCNSCNYRFQDNYIYKAYEKSINTQIVNLTKEGVGIRSIARLLNISPTTVMERIKVISRQIPLPFLAKNKTYELDEMCTYVKLKKNRIWIAYAIRKDTREVVSLSVGNRSNKTLRKITDSLILASAKKIFTDRLKNYRYLLPKAIHNTKKYGINHIERKNLTLRTHLKRLGKKSICFSRSIVMLIACLKIYFWA
jgi:IS1 family transposase/transposase-like protein